MCQLTSGRLPEPLEKQAAKARGDGLTPGHRKVEDKVDEVASAELVPISTQMLPELPSDLGARGELEWYKMWEFGTWLRPQEDYRWLEMICRSYDDINTFRAQILKDGLVIKGYAGQAVAHPLIAEVRSAERTIQKCLSVLGFSPTDRARLGLAEIKRKTGLADLQNRTRGE
jgi:P27 family predicted phage terminase small subunit